MAEVQVIFLEKPHIGIPCYILHDGKVGQTAKLTWVQNHPEQQNAYRVMTAANILCVGCYDPSLSELVSDTLKAQQGVTSATPSTSPQVTQLTQHSPASPVLVATRQGCTPEWLIILLLIIFPPAGIVVMWREASWGGDVKGMITAIWLICLGLYISGLR